MTWTDPDHCKHFDLVVQRNNGYRWVTCTICHADFERVEPVDNELDEDVCT